MKISIIGAGNVGSLAAMHVAAEGFSDIVLIDKVPGLPQGKCLDMEDAAFILKKSYQIEGTQDIGKIKNSRLVVITAGLARKPGMTREDLLNKNAQILKDICLDIKELAPEAIVIVVTNPLDLMTYLALKITGFKKNKILGMGITLDTSRFTNLISKELKIPHTDIEATVIGSHGDGMLPLPRFTKVKGIALDEFMGQEKVQDMVKRTTQRGAEIVSFLGSGSAYFAPSLAIAQLVKVILKDEKKILGASVYLNGEYGLKDVCIGVPCRLGKEGVEQIIELELNKQEKETFINSAAAIRNQYPLIIQ
jgi:malate dehydrogenase